MRHVILAVASGLAFFLGAPARAAQSYTFDFSALTPGAPTATHDGSFTLQLDAGVWTLQSIDFAVGSTTFDTSNTGFGLDYYYYIGGTTSGAEFVSAGTDDFLFRFAFTDPLDPTTFTPWDFYYSEAGYQDIAISTPEEVTLSLRDTDGVPEPGTWAMMLLGFGAVGLAGRRSRVLAPRSA